jgi:hypothetical protein
MRKIERGRLYNGRAPKSRGRVHAHAKNTGALSRKTRNAACGSPSTNKSRLVRSIKMIPARPSPNGNAIAEQPSQRASSKVAAAL